MAAPVVPTPSDYISQRAWEAAYVLGSDYRERLTASQTAIVDRMFRHGPYEWGWIAVCTIWVLYGQVVERRM